MKQKFAKLIDVKSIVTILLTAVFCVLALRRTISAEQFITVFTVVISFYYTFGINIRFDILCL